MTTKNSRSKFGSRIISSHLCASLLGVAALPGLRKIWTKSQMKMAAVTAANSRTAFGIAILKWEDSLAQQRFQLMQSIGVANMQLFKACFIWSPS